MRKVNEIFYSIQGEGFHSGTPAVFVRFSGCNLECPFCDTEHRTYTRMGDEEIVGKVMGYPTNLVVLTGGEPGLSIDECFVQMLKDTGKTVAVETNGTVPLPGNLDWVTLSPKDGFNDHAVTLIRECDELKVVYRFQPLDHYFDIVARHYYLQPCDMGDEVLNKEITAATVQACLRDPRWRVSLQTQKTLQVR